MRNRIPAVFSSYNGVVFLLDLYTCGIDCAFAALFQYDIYNIDQLFANTIIDVIILQSYRCNITYDPTWTRMLRSRCSRARIQRRMGFSCKIRTFFFKNPGRSEKRISFTVFFFTQKTLKPVVVKVFAEVSLQRRRAVVDQIIPIII